MPVKYEIRLTGTRPPSRWERRLFTCHGEWETKRLFDALSEQHKDDPSLSPVVFRVTTDMVTTEFEND